MCTSKTFFLHFESEYPYFGCAQKANKGDPKGQSREFPNFLFDIDNISQQFLLLHLDFIIDDF